LLLILTIKISLWWGVLGLILGSLAMFYPAYSRLPGLWQTLSAIEKVQAIFWIPLIRITGDIAKMLGYPMGWKWRLERLSTQPELRWRIYRETVR
jgi:hypothetical protein